MQEYCNMIILNEKRRFIQLIVMTCISERCKLNSFISLVDIYFRSIFISLRFTLKYPAA